jgi:P27 family predicted phage terminase small subunit
VAIHKLDGTYQPCRHAGSEPQPMLQAPDCPPSLSREEKAIWHYCVPILSEVKVLTLAERYILETYCIAVATIERAAAAIRREGDVVIVNMQAYKNPWRTVYKEAYDQMIKSGSELGMTPAARCRLRVQEPEKEAEDPMTAMLQAKAARRAEMRNTCA